MEAFARVIGDGPPRATEVPGVRVLCWIFVEDGDGFLRAHGGSHAIVIICHLQNVPQTFGFEETFSRSLHRNKQRTQQEGRKEGRKEGKLIMSNEGK